MEELLLNLTEPTSQVGEESVCVQEGGRKGWGKDDRLKLTGVHISPFDSYKCCKYHLPIILGSEFEVQSFKYRIYPLYASWSPYTAKGNVQFMNPISLS